MMQKTSLLTFRRWTAAAGVTLLIATAVVPAWSQGGCPRGGTCVRSTSAPSKVTLTGQVSAIRHIPSPSGSGVHLTLKTADQGILEVQLGPASYVDKQSLHLAEGDQVQVIGTKTCVQGKTSVVASQVVRGEGKMELRDASGRPRWAGQGMRQRNQQ